jgi:hypothetical protein
MNDPALSLFVMQEVELAEGTKIKAESMILQLSFRSHRPLPKDRLLARKTDRARPRESETSSIVMASDGFARSMTCV